MCVCISGSSCIDARFKCDRVPDCTDESDEGGKCDDSCDEGFFMCQTGLLSDKVEMGKCFLKIHQLFPEMTPL